jgi:hypothetical protein
VSILGWAVLCNLAGCASGVDASQAPIAVEETGSALITSTLTYKANNQFFVELPGCGTSKNILLKEPAGAGPFPVVIFLTGTWGIYDANYPSAILTEAANQGFVAASVDYQVNTLPKMCEENAWYKTRCMFSTSFNPQSAIGAVCARPKADCNGMGVVVVGHSQGGAHAAMARNFDTRVRGAWTMGFASQHWDGTPQPCMNEGPAELGTASKRILKNDRLRLVRGGNEGADPAVMNQTTGRSCPAGTSNCLLGAHESGWYFVPNDEVNFTLNPNKHCFMENNPLDSSGNKVDCGDPHAVDPKFGAVPPETTYPSGMYQNLQWLKTTILPLGNQ